MSHQEYVDQNDEDQLADLITRAQARIAGIQASGWVKLWVVSIGWGNEAWFPEDQREAAVAWLCKELPKRMARQPENHGTEAEVSLVRYRPNEVAELLRRAGPQSQEKPCPKLS